MGYMRHHAIIVTSWSNPDIERAHDESSEIFPWVSPLSPETINGWKSFFIPPDGSKEGWEESITGEVQYGDDNLETLIVNDSDSLRREKK